MSRIQRLFKHSFVYAIGSAIQGVVGFLLVPIYTRNVSVADFGKLDLLNTIFLILASLISLGLPSAYIKVVERNIGKDKDADKKTLASTTTYFSFFFTIISLGILVGFAPRIASFFGFENPNILYIVFGALLSLILSNIGFAFLRADEKSTYYTATNVAKYILLLGVNIYLVGLLKLGIEGVFIGILIAHSFSLILLLFPILKRLQAQFSSELLKKLLSFGIAVIPAGLALWVMDLADRFFINHYLSFEEVGIYSLVYKFGIALSIGLVAPFQLAWPTFSFSIAKNDDAKETYAKALSYFLIISLGLISVFITFGEQGILILGNKSYLSGLNLILPITLSYVCLGAHYIIVTGLHIKEKTKWYPPLIALPALLNIGLNFALIPKYGILGAAIATLASFGFMLVLTHFVVEHVYGFVYEWSRIGKILLAFLATIGVNYALDNIESPLILKIAIPLTFVLLIFVLKAISASEIKSAKKLAKSFMKR